MSSKQLTLFKTLKICIIGKLFTSKHERNQHRKPRLNATAAQECHTVDLMHQRGELMIASVNVSLSPMKSWLL